MANKRAVLGRPLPDASVPRNAFDRSFTRSFQGSLGMALPAASALAVIAGSHTKINRKIFQRTAEVNTAAFTPLDTHIQYYFVPMRQLMTEWDDFKLNIQDFNSSFYATSAGSDTFSPSSKVPWCTLGEIKTVLAAATLDKDGVGYPFVNGALRLLDLLGYGNYASVDDMVDNVEVNLLRLCAYQKVYYDHFRNTAYEGNIPLAYNMDYYRSASYHVTDAAVLKRLLTLRYVNYRKDYFQNLYPALNYVVSYPNGSNWTLPSWVQGTSFGGSSTISLGNTGYDSKKWEYNDGENLPSSISVAQVGTSADGSLTSITPSVPDTGVNGIRHRHSLDGLTLDSDSIIPILNVQTIRAEFALDKLMRSSAYAPKHAKDQYEARYGIKFNYNPNESIFIGSYMNDIIINEVTNMAQTKSGSTGANLGDIGGKGTSFGDYGNTLTFDNKEDGFIIPIVYTLPRQSYSSMRIDNYNLKVGRTDFFIPEFMDLGLRPIYRREFFNQYSSTAATNLAWVTKILGYNPPYQEYKIGIDENTGLFGRPADSNELTKFVINTNLPNSNVDQIGINTDTDGVTQVFFKVKPYDARNIFLTAFDGTLQTDQLISYCRFNYVVTQNMSVHGQPRL